MSKYSVFLTTCLLAIVLLISYWLNNEVLKELEIKEKKLTSNPDYFLKKFYSKKTDRQGKLNYSLTADSMKYFEYSDTSNLIKPKFIQYENRLNVLQTSSLKGSIYDNGEKILMNNNVEIVRSETKNKKVMKLFTNQVLILPNEEILRSDEKVKIVQEPNIEVDGVGLDYNKKNGIVKILKNVKVKYDK